MLSSYKSCIAQDFFKPQQNYEIPFGLIIGTLLLDKTIQKMAFNNQNAGNDKLFKIDRYYGDRLVTSVSLLSLYGFAYLVDDPQMKSMSERAILSAVVSVISASALKELFGRSRPYKGHGHMHFKPFAFKESRRSMPSSHAAATFAISTVFADEYENIFWKSFWYGGAILVSMARVYKNQHWASDVVAGSAIGYVIAKKTSFLLKEKATPRYGMAFIENQPVLSISLNF